MNIQILTIPREKMRHGVDGADWYWDEQGNLQVRVCPMTNWRHEALLAIHEAVEALMCRHNGVSQQQVDQFDAQFDAANPDDLDAGDDPAAPYEREHCFATAIERTLCAELGVKWAHYDQELRDTYPGPKHRHENR